MKDALASAVWRRARLFLLGQVLGWTFATLAALLLSNPHFNLFGYFWVTISLGPLTGRLGAFPMCGIPMAFWWVTVFLIPAHPIYPSRWTGTLTMLGLLCWYFQGFASALMHFAT
jgi:hypothetical protein